MPIPLIDAVTEEVWNDETSPSSVTIPHAVSGVNRAIFVGVGTYGSGSPAPATGVTYNGVSLSKLWGEEASSYHSSGWLLVAPDTGTHDVVVSFGGVTPQQYNPQGIVVISLNLVDQSTPNGTVQTASGYGTSPSVTVSPDSSDLIIDTIRSGNSLTIGANQTQRLTGTPASPRSCASTQSGADGGVMSWTQSSQWWVMGAVPFKYAAAAPSGVGSTDGNPLSPGIHFAWNRNKCGF